MNIGVVLCGFFVVILWVSLGTNSEQLKDLLLVNAGVQCLLFVLIACIPYLRTGRMSFVDIAWPFGVALIGAQLLLFADGEFIRKLVVGSVYLFIGLRMGVGAIVMGKRTGVIFETEFPRYQYRHMVLKESGTKRIKLHALLEMMAQGFANMTVLALPGFLIAINPSSEIYLWEILGLALWAIAYTLESVADTQKLLFISKDDSGLGVCNIGLWQYSRHPNYFSEWLVWTGLVIATVPSWLRLQASETLFVWFSLGVGALCASLMLYITLVYLTGVEPSEYYSVRKRPGYKAYQEATNRFFPWFSKT